MNKCSIKGCFKPHFAKTYCNTHHKRYLRHGDPLIVKSRYDGKRQERKRVYNKQYAKNYYRTNSLHMSLYQSIVYRFRRDEVNHE